MPRKIILLAGLGFGDEGKGTMVDYHVRALMFPDYVSDCTVVRYNGGPQCGHEVVALDGRSHVFAQFGAGTFTPGACTHLSRFMMFEPFALVREEEHLRTLGVTDAFARLTVDSQAPVITPFHWTANRLEELSRGQGRHGSCGRGVGRVRADLLEHGGSMLFAGDLTDRHTVKRRLRFIRDLQASRLESLPPLPHTDDVNRELRVFSDPVLVEEWVDLYVHIAKTWLKLVSETHLPSLLADGESLVFEGAQGVLLDESYGFYPHNTWTDITFHNANVLLDEAGVNLDETMKVGVLRAYATRHGAGPFVTEDPDLTAALPDPNNKMCPWQGGFRVGHFDAVAARYALRVLEGVDEIALTHLDRLPVVPKICTAYCTAELTPAFFEYPYRDRIATDIVKLGYDDIGGYPSSDNQLLLRHQELLTGMLFLAKPVLEEPRVPHSGHFADAVEAEIGTPVVTESYGPKATDKISRKFSTV